MNFGFIKLKAKFCHLLFGLRGNALMARHHTCTSTKLLTHYLLLNGVRRPYLIRIFFRKLKNSGEPPVPNLYQAA